MATQTAKDVLKFAKDNKVEAVDLKFLDFLGTWQHFTIPTSELSEDLFEEGSGFDGSSIRGWQPINASDMLVIPDPTTAVIDPFMALPTLSLICNIVDPITKEDYSRDPRNIARKAEAYLKSTGIGDVAYFGPEPEFFVFDEVRYEQNQHTGLLPHRLGRGAVEHGPRDRRGERPQRQGRREPEPRLQAALQGRLLPGRADRHPAGHPRRDGARDGEGRHPRREAPPRGGDRRPGRDRHALPAARQDGRRAHVVQVHRQERRAPLRQDGDVHAEADLRRQRHRHARPPVDLEGREAAVRRRPLRRHERARDALHRRHPEARAGAGRVHQSRRRTPTTGSCPASRRR